MNMRYPTSWLLGLASLMASPAWANTSCVVTDKDLPLLVQHEGKILPLAGRNKSLLQPCDATVRPGTSKVKVMVSRTQGSTEIVLVPPGERLSTYLGKPLLDMARSDGSVQALWRVLTSERPTRTGSRKFDSLEGLILGGNVLAGEPLSIPLESFGWQPGQPVSVQYGSRPARALSATNGLLRLTIEPTPDQEILLRQGSRQAVLTTVAASEYPELAPALQVIRTADEEFRHDREALLLWSQDLKINALSVHVSHP